MTRKSNKRVPLCFLNPLKQYVFLEFLLEKKSFRFTKKALRAGNAGTK